MKVSDVTNVLEAIAPCEYAAEWDNVGLLVGSPDDPVRRVLLTIDLTDEVVDEAIAAKAGLIVAYHPPIFRPLKTLVATNPRQRAVLNAARAGCAIYSPHTALDAAPGGVNDWLAAAFGDGDIRALEYHAVLPPAEQCKIVTMCPPGRVDDIRGALATAGAGRVGDYELCSFEIRGHGTFLGGEASTPTIGTKGTFERVEETRLEMVCPSDALALIVATLREFHPYEEPPIEIYPLRARPQRSIGMGRRVVLDRAQPLAELARRLKTHLEIDLVRAAVAPGGPESFRTVGICAGAGGSLIDAAVSQGCELFVTGEMTHHAVMDARGRGCAVMLAGHTNTERGYLPRLRGALRERLDDLVIDVSSADESPLRAMG